MSTERKIELWDAVPATARDVLESVGDKIGVSGPTMAAAVLAWDAISKLPLAERGKAVAVLLGLHTRDRR